MEAVSEKVEDHTYNYTDNYTDQPDLDRAEYREFRFHFQGSILLSLLACGDLTRQQYNSCMEKLADKYANQLTPASHTIANRQGNTVECK